MIGAFIRAGLSAEKKEKSVQALADPLWLEALKRCEKTFGMEGISFEYFRYASAVADVTFWVKNSRSVSILVSDGFLKVATESQAARMIESVTPATLKKIRKSNLQKTFFYLFSSIKGDSHRMRHWIYSFLLYPLERFIYGNAKN